MCTDGASGGNRNGGGWWKPVAAVVLTALYGATVLAAEPASFADALASGKPSLDLRYRYEHVDQDGIADDANASTLRLRLNYSTGAWEGLSAFAEFDYVAEVLLDDFNNAAGTSPARTRYPVVADPHGTDLNQLYLDYAASGRLLVRAGRQRILLDNQRFVGGVGWRQNEQTYDGVLFKWAATDAVDVQYAWVGRVNRIFGDRSIAGRHDGSTHLLNVGITLNNQWTLTPYGYLVDNDDAPALSTATFGARLAGSVPLGERRLSLTAEAAQQRDTGSAPVDFSAAYVRLDAALALTDHVRINIGYEILEGDANDTGEAFRTPLATLHAFQGWADQFLATPDAGIEDLFVGATINAGAWTFNGTWHDFTAESGGGDWGSELDVSASRKLGSRYGLLLKAALFDAGSPAYSDVTKAWLMLTAGF